MFNSSLQILSGEKDGNKGGLGGLFSWVSSGSGGPPSLLTRSYAAEVPWFALCVLIGEAQEEMSSGLWKSLLSRLHSHSHLPLDTTLKVSFPFFVFVFSYSFLRIKNVCWKIKEIKSVEWYSFFRMNLYKKWCLERRYSNFCVVSTYLQIFYRSW